MCRELTQRGVGSQAFAFRMTDLPHDSLGERLG
jgi:hypothetical protein